MKGNFVLNLLMGGLFVFLLGCTADKEILKGKRERILMGPTPLEVEENPEDINIELDEPVENDSWTQPSDNVPHVIPHADFDHKDVTLWERSIGWGSSGADYLVAQPVSDGEFIFAIDSGGELSARLLATGKTMWSQKMPLTAGAKNALGGGLCESQGRLYIACSSSDIFCCESATGKILWQRSVTHPIRSAPVVKDGRLFIITKQNAVLALNAETGEKIWSHEGGVESCSCLGGGSVAIDKGVVIVPYVTGEVFALKVENGLPLWSDSLHASHKESSVSMMTQIDMEPVMQGGKIFVSSQGGKLVALDFKTGARIWEKNISCMTTPIISGAFLFVVSRQGDVVCLTKDLGKVVWTKNLKENIPHQVGKESYWFGPLLLGKKLYAFSSDGKVSVLLPTTGAFEKTFSVSGPVHIAPIALKKMLVFLNDNGKLIVRK